MIRCVRLSTGEDGASHVELGRVDLSPGRNDDLVSASMAAAHVTIEETAGGGSLAWHTAPVRQLEEYPFPAVRTLIWQRAQHARAG